MNPAIDPERNPLGLFPGRAVDVLIDGPSLYGTAKNLGFEVDFKNFLALFRPAEVRRAYYFALMPEGDDFNPIKPLLDWLGFNGFRVIDKPMREFADEAGRRRVKGSLAVEIAVEMLDSAAFGNDIVLVSGDSDLVSAVERAQTRGSRITVLSSMKTQPNPAIAENLRWACDNFVELETVRDLITRAPREPRDMRQGTLRAATTRPVPAN